jgi:uncharacterized protein involved in tellurium resistance
MTIKTPEKHNITVNKTEGDDRELSCTQSPILVQFVPAIVERHTQMNRGT